jgi:hypothetical protein
MPPALAQGMITIWRITPGKEKSVPEPDTGMRDFAAAECARRFGEPERFPTVDGILYRWVVTCADGRKMRITLDSPEFPTMAHFLVSDTRSATMLSAETCRTRSDVLALLDRLELAKRGTTAPA